MYVVIVFNQCRPRLLDCLFEELDVANMSNMVFVFSKKRAILFIILCKVYHQIKSNAYSCSHACAFNNIKTNVKKYQKKIMYLRIEVHFFCLHWEMKYTSLRSDLRFTRFTRDRCPFISQCKQKICTSILIFMLKQQ